MEQQIKVAVDAVVFGYDDRGLSVLLIERKKAEGKRKWALPGGFVENSESLEQAVRRELKEETNLSLRYLQQFKTYGAIDRDQRGRVISIAHLVLVKKKKRKPTAGDDAKDVKWLPIQMIPKLAFDHNEIISDALNVLRNKMASLNTDCIEDVPTPADIKLISSGIAEQK